MKILSVVGKTDKRLLTYPLMHILALAGRTVVITDDVAYRRLYKGFTDNGEVHDLSIKVIPDLDTKKIEQITSGLRETSENEYDFCLVITDIHRCKNADATLCVCANSKSFLGTRFEEFTEQEPNAFKAFISIGDIKKKEWEKLGVTPLQWTSSRFSYIYECEERKTLIPFQDKEVLNVIGTAFLKEINLTVKAFLKVSKRKLN